VQLVGTWAARWPCAAGSDAAHERVTCVTGSSVAVPRDIPWPAVINSPGMSSWWPPVCLPSADFLSWSC